MATAIAPKKRPILFSGPMVRAILEDRKTQTRRVVKPQIKSITRRDIGEGCSQVVWHQPPKITRNAGGGSKDGGLDILKSMINEFSPYGKPGDRLWVRESGWLDSERRFYAYDENPVIAMDRDGGGIIVAEWTEEKTRAFVKDKYKRCPSIHSPRWASRINLEVTDIRVERIQDITEEDARAEGAAYRIAPGGDLEGAFAHDPTPICYREHFRELWDSINAKRGYSWESNPWLWAVTFKRI